MTPRRVFDFESFCDAHDIAYNVVREWAQVDCPMPGCTSDGGRKAAFNLHKNFFTCWRCGRHSKLDMVRAFLDCDAHTAIMELEEHGGGLPKEFQRSVKFRDIEVTLPLGTGPLCPAAIEYLEGRGYDVSELVDAWKLQSTIGVGKLAHRVIVPIYFNSGLVSWTGRSYNTSCKERYRSCDQDKERVPHKSICYGWDYVGDTALVVEGPPDVWRMGPGVVGLFGKTMSPGQLDLLRSLRKVYIMLDPEPLAQIDARAIKAQLSLYTDVENIELRSGTDPGDLTKEQVTSIRKELGL